METKAIRLWKHDYPASLSGEHWKDPLAVIDQFFSSYTLQEVQLWLRQSLPLVFTHQMEVSPEQRYQCLCLVNRLEKLVDATYVLVSSPNRVAGINSPKNIRQSIALNTLSFLSEQEAGNPLRTIRQVFSNAGQDRWKPGLLKDLRRALFDPSLSISANSGELREFDHYLDLNKLLEAAFLLCKNQQLPEVSSLHWSLQDCHPDPLTWGSQFYTEAGIRQALESLAFINHYRRWRVDWYASAGLLFLHHYQIIYRLIYLAGWLSTTSGRQQDDETLVKIRQALVKQFAREPAGDYARFLNLCLRNAFEYDPRPAAAPSGKLKIGQLENILHLSANYFIHRSKSSSS